LAQPPFQEDNKRYEKRAYSWLASSLAQFACFGLDRKVPSLQGLSFYLSRIRKLIVGWCRGFTRRG